MRLASLGGQSARNSHETRERRDTGMCKRIRWPHSGPRRLLTPPGELRIQPLPKTFLEKRSGKLRSRPVKLTAKTTTGPGHTAVWGYFSPLITAHPALFTTSSPISPPSSRRQGYDRQASLRQPPPLGELWRSRGDDRQAGTAQRLFQEPPA